MPVCGRASKEQAETNWRCAIPKHTSCSADDPSSVIFGVERRFVVGNGGRGAYGM